MAVAIVLRIEDALWNRLGLTRLREFRLPRDTFGNKETLMRRANNKTIG
jgi:hypothetical protein